MICKHCQNENEDGTLFCSSCGKPLAQEDPNKTSSKSNTRLYIGISIALMIFLAGGLVFGFFYFSNKVQKANEERNTIASQSDVAANYFRAQIREQEDTISELEKKIDDLEASINEYKQDAEAYQNEIEELKSRQEAMDGLASFTDAISYQGYEDMFVSDTVLRLGTQEAVVRICITGNLEVAVTSDHEEVAQLSWDSAPQGPGVARLRVIPKSNGTAILTVTNNMNNEQIQIYVYVDSDEMETQAVAE